MSDDARRERAKTRKAKYRRNLPDDKKEEVKRKERLRKAELRANMKCKSGEDNWDQRRNRSIRLLAILANLRRVSSSISELTAPLERYRRVNDKGLLLYQKNYNETRSKITKSCVASRRLLKARLTRLRWCINNRLRLMRQGQDFSMFEQDISVFQMSLKAYPNLNMKERLTRAQLTADAAREVQRVTTDEILKIITGIRAQVSGNVAHPPSTSHMDKAVREVGRMRYHNAARSDPDSLPLSTIYPTLYRQFMGLPEPVEDVTVEVSVVVEDLMNNVERMFTSLRMDAVDGENIDEREEGDVAADGLDLAMLTRAGNDVLDEDPAMRQFAANIPPSIITRVIRAIPCSENYTGLTSREANLIQDETEKLGTATVDELCKTKLAEYERKVLPILRKRSPCYAVLRSLNTRLRELKLCVQTLQNSEGFLLGRSSSLWENIISRDWLWLPQRARKSVEPLFSTKDKEIHNYDRTIRRYGDAIDNFKTQIGQLEIEVCDVCARFTTPNRMRNATADMQADLRSDSDTIPSVCERCRGEVTRLRKNGEPIFLKFGARNNCEFEEIPDELKNLNWIERAIIQRVRTIRAVGCLKNIVGQSTSMRSATGGMVILPVSTEGTIDHVIETLPSESAVTIIVNAQEVKFSRLVCMPRILRALEYLKRENRHYAQIVINDNFRFTNESILAVDNNGSYHCLTQHQLSQLITDDENDRSLLSHAGTRAEVVRSNNPGARATTAYEEYNLQKIAAKPLLNQEKFIDERAYPWHFPSGRYGYNCDQREKKITPRLFVRWALSTPDRRIATDPNALAFYQGIFEQADIRSALGMQARMSRTELENETCEAMEAAASIDFQIKLQTVSRNIRGTLKYWESVRRTVKSHIAIFGSPTWFQTLNPAEKHWDDVITIYQEIYGDKVNATNIFEWISHDPFFFARYFIQRVRSFFKELLFKDNGPLGTVVNYFYRIEYQFRGTPHVHCLLWCKGAPAENAPDSEKLEYLSGHVTARLPDEKTEPTEDKCRFGFPRPITPVPLVNEKAEELAGLPGASGKTYFLARTKDETFINDYSPALLIAWGGNIDTQYVFGGCQQAISYITGYASKSEKPKEGSEVQKALKGATDTREGMKTLVAMTKMRECGKLEIVDQLQGHKLFEFESDHVNINLNDTNKRVRALKGRQLMEMGGKKCIDNIYDDYYPKRPNQLRHFSLLTILMYFRVETPKKNQNCEDENEEEEDRPISTGNVNIFSSLYHPDSPFSPFYSIPTIPTGTRIVINDVETKRVFVKLGKPLVPTFFWPNLEQCNEESREDYFRRLCAFEGSEDPLKLNAFADIRLIIKHHEALIEQDRVVRERRREIRELVEAMREGEEEEEGAIELFERIVDATKHNENMGNMNGEQHKLFDEVSKVVDDQDEFDRKIIEIGEDHRLNPAEKKEEIKKLGARPDQLLRLVLGNAGCGKSFVINTIADHFTLSYTTDSSRGHQPAVVLAAPTGLAAVQINGATLHSLLKIEVQHGRDAAIRPMSEKNLNTTRIQFRNVRLLIIDEISMVSNIILTKIHFRLQEIKGNEELFGGLNVMLLGDLMQLLPVKAPAIYETLDAAKRNRIFNSVLSSLNLFSFFSNSELVQNMRQQGDISFAEILQRMRVQQMTDDDFEMLETRKIAGIEDSVSPIDTAASYYAEIQKKDPTALALVGTNAEVDALNKAVIGKLGYKVTEVECEDTPLQSSKRRGGKKDKTDPVGRIYQRAEFDISNKPTENIQRSTRKKWEKSDNHNKHAAHKAAGLEQTLFLAEKGRVSWVKWQHTSIASLNDKRSPKFQISSSKTDRDMRAQSLRDDQGFRMCIIQRAAKSLTELHNPSTLARYPCVYDLHALFNSSLPLSQPRLV